MVIDTLGKLHQRTTLHAHCRVCAHYRELDVPALIAKLGPDYLLDDLRARLTCTKCGVRNCLMQQSWDIYK